MKKPKNMKRTSAVTRFIVKENYSGNRESQELFADIIISEHNRKCKDVWTRDKQGDIIKLPTVKS